MNKNNLVFIPVGKAKDLTGQQFGRLTVLGRAPAKSRKAFWWCECECGNITSIRADQLVQGVTKSCGCYKQEINKQQGHELAIKYSSINGKKNKKDLTGQRFNHLLVLKDTNKRKQFGNCTHVIWLCQCDCGNLTEVTGGHLSSGQTQSCGCIKMSRGEEKIANLLIQNNISYCQEFIYKQEKLSTGGYPRFDFFVNNQYVIEYDGEQHFNTTTHGWNNPQNLKINQQRDYEKNLICQKYHIPIIRIPYTHFNSIVLNDLLLETSSFIVQEI